MHSSEGSRLRARRAIGRAPRYSARYGHERRGEGCFAITRRAALQPLASERENSGPVNTDVSLDVLANSEIRGAHIPQNAGHLAPKNYTYVHVRTRTRQKPAY